MIFKKRVTQRLQFMTQILICILFSLVSFSDGVLYCKCNDHNKCLINDKKQFGNTSHFYCTIKEKGHCFAARVIDVDTSLHLVTANIVQRYGCLSTDTKSILSCNGHYFNSTLPVAIDCCNKTIFCNAALHPKFYHFESDEEAINSALSHKRSVTDRGSNHSDHPTKLGPGPWMLVVCVCVLVVCMCVCVAVVCYCRQRLHWASKQVLGQGGVSRMCSGTQDSALLPVHAPSQAQSHTATTGSLMTASSLLTNTMTTNVSHYRLAQRTIGHQILFTQLLGKGRFSEVWAGDWLGEIVAVKHLHQQGRPIHETLWLRTISLYYSYPVQHNHVTSLLGSDKIPQDVLGPCALTLVLIYPYYHWGTLARLMASSHWDLSAAVAHHSPGHASSMNSRLDTLSHMAFSLLSGLCYLHTEIAATKGKPAIAHRNLKASNIYVKDDYSCCIGDLEWALIGRGNNGKEFEDRCTLESQILPQLTAPNGLMQLPDFEYYVASVLLSTDCRYVAPELLECSDPNNGRSHSPILSVEDYKKSDVYSLSLILWELLVWFEPRLKPAVYSYSSLSLSLSDERLLSSPSSVVPPVSLSSSSSSSSTWIYQPAYQTELIQLRQSLGCDASHLYDEPRPAEMYRLLVAQNIRPGIDCQRIPNNQSSNGSDIVQLLCRIIPQCWCSMPDSRLSCLKVKKYLSELLDSASQTEPL